MSDSTSKSCAGAPEKKFLAKFHFTSCIAARSSIEELAEGAAVVAVGSVASFSPVFSRWGKFRECKRNGEGFCRPVKSIGRGAASRDHNIDGEKASSEKPDFAPGFF